MATLVYALLAALVLFSALALYLAELRLAEVSDPSLAFVLLALAIFPLAALFFWSARRLQRDAERTIDRQRWLATTLSSLADGVITTDDAGSVTFLNKRAEELLGVSEPEVIGHLFFDLLRVRKITDALQQPLSRALRTGESAQTPVPIELSLQDGTVHLVACKATPVRESAGRIAGCVIVLQDVTERALADTALHASQEIFATITEHISDFVEVLDLQGRRLYCSASFSRILDSPRGLYLSDSVSSIHPDDRPAVLAALEQTKTSGVAPRVNCRLLARDGRTIHLELLASLIRDAEGKPQRILVVSRDDTERQIVEARLREEKEFSESLVNSMPGVFYLADGNGKLLRWNRNLVETSGHSAEELPLLPPLGFISPEHRPLAAARMADCLRLGAADLECLVTFKDGTRRPYYITGVRIDVAGGPCVLGVALDISERVRAEEAVRATMRRLGRQNRALSEYSRSAVVRTGDLDAALRRISEVSAETLEVARASIWLFDDGGETMRCINLFEQPARRHSSGMVLTAHEYPAYFAALAAHRSIAVADGRSDPRTAEFAANYLTPLGISSLLDAPIRSGGHLVGVICNEHIGPERSWTPDEQNFAGSMADLVSLSLEVNQRQRAEAELREARDHLEVKVAERTRDLAEANERLTELDRLKSEFLATMSHELRTPLNSIIGFTGILRQGLAGPLNEEQLKQLGMVHFSARHLLALINDLLDLSRIESGKMEVIAETFALEEVIAEVAQSLQPTVAQKGLRFTTHLDPPHLPMQSDRKKMFQILLNLANNAVKFTERGSVTIDAQVESGEVTISVSDTGIGIRAESIGGLFQAFRQVDGSARRVYEGTGLGLYLCRQLVTMLGGNIHAESEFGLGSRFTVKLPAVLPTS